MKKLAKRTRGMTRKTMRNLKKTTLFEILIMNVRISNAFLQKFHFEIVHSV